MTNPFDLHGPQFLGFYVGLAGVVVGGLALLRPRGSRATVHRTTLTDPYSIATLRGGNAAAFSTALVSLVTRKLIDVQDDRLVTKPGAKVSAARHPLERAVLRHFAVAQPARPPHGGDVVDACVSLSRDLQGSGLVVGDAATNAQIVRVAVAVALLFGVAMVKVGVAFSRGRHNVAFLVIFAIVACFVATLQAPSRVTSAGRALLADLERLFDGVRNRVWSDRTDPDELAIRAAVFGVEAVPASVFPARRLLLPPERPQRRQGLFSGSSSCGTSIWSSCGTPGSSCGSSCGGGGCGGGCGGCGS
jgi:uncharacterized protein (TIGR04222 family)